MKREMYGVGRLISDTLPGIRFTVYGTRCETRDPDLRPPIFGEGARGQGSEDSRGQVLAYQPWHSPQGKIILCVLSDLCERKKPPLTSDLRDPLYD